MLTGQLALVTGASRGIGQAIALQLAGLGARVIGTATTVEGAKEIGAYLAEAGFQGEGVRLEVRDQAQIDALIGSAEENYGQSIGILVNNAGITRDNLALRMKDDEWDAVIDVNLKAVFKLSKAVMRGMIKARYGRIVNVTSVVAHRGNEGQVNYCAAKSGVAGISRSLARELAGRGITVNCVAPGFIDTDMTKDLSEAQKALLIAEIPAGRLGSPADIAAAVAYLASPSAAYVTGTTLHVNGGMYMD